MVLHDSSERCGVGGDSRRKRQRRREREVDRIGPKGDIVAAGPGVVNPELTKRVEPRIPPAARTLRAASEVQLQLLIGTDGSVEQVRLLKVERPGVGFEKASEEAVRQWKYQPATKDGVKVRMWIAVRIVFKIQ